MRGAAGGCLLGHFIIITIIIIIVIIVIIVIFIIITIVIIIVIIITGQPSSWQCGANCPRLRVPCRLLPGYGPPARGRQGH